MSEPPYVCVIDDSADYRFLLERLFNRYLPQHPVRLFGGGEALLAELPHLSYKPSLFLLDRHMPGMNGHQVLVRLKQDVLYKKIPIVMMSAGASAEEIDACYESGVNSFLKKIADPASQHASLSTICHYWLELNQMPRVTQ